MLIEGWPNVIIFVGCHPEVNLEKWENESRSIFYLFYT